MSKTDKQNRLKSTVLAVAIALAPMAAQAAGLGKLTVISALGQPLKAEIELTASREEYSSITARLASAEAFRNAGIEYVPALAGVRLTLDKRPNGQPILRVSSDRPLNEPFVDMLVEVNWASGRLVREYTFLLDPPDVFQKPSSAPVPVIVPEVKKEAPAPAPAPVIKPEPELAAPAQPEIRPAAPAAEEKPAKKPVAQEAKPAKKPVEKAASKVADKPAEKPTEKAPEGGATRVVKSGDTLSKIAGQTKPEGVSLDQMLVALFRNNKDVFDGGNMNRLRAGKILSIPEPDAIASVDAGEARKIVVAQAADFNAYRKKLAAVAAAAPAKEEAPKQAVSGKITPKVEDKVPTPAAGKDKLEVSRSEAGKDGGKGVKGRAAAIEEDLIARDKALKDANARIAELEKNINDLKKLAELKSAAGAKVQEQAKAVAEAKRPEPPKPAESAKPLPAAKAPEKPAEPPRVEDVVKPAEAPQPAEAAKPAAKPPVSKKPVVPPPPPPPPPSFVEDNPELVFGGGGVLALLLGLLGFKAWRKKKEAGASAAPESIAPSSMFAATGGESIDTGAALPTDFSPDSVAAAAGDEGVDPVAEADVYMAYGRDKQAEEILLEALKTDPARRAIHLKLLEIYANRKSASQFEAVARDLNALTGGSGEEWDKAVALGRVLDPANPLYGGVPATESVQPVEMPAPVAEAPAEEVVPAPVEAAPEEVPVQEEAAPTPEEIPASLDFDLDLGAPAAPAPEAVAESEPAAPAAEEAMSLDFDLDLGSPTPEAPAAEPAPAEEAAAPAGEEAAALDFDLGTAESASAEAVAAAPAVEVSEEVVAEEVPAPADATSEAAALDFDLDLGAPAEVPAAEAAASEALPEAPPLDLSSISLELGEPETAPAAPVEDLAAALDMPSVEFAAGALPEAPAAEPAVSLDMPTIEMPPLEELAVPAAETPAEEVPAVEAPALSLGMPVIEMPLAEPAAEPAAEPVESPAEIGLDLELPVAGADEPSAPVEAPAAADDFSFDLDLPAETEAPAAEMPVAETPVEASPAEAMFGDNAEVATKLELALAYEEMGDKEGARELLQEVLNEGSPAQQEMARNKLAALD